MSAKTEAHHRLDGEILRATGKRYEVDTSGLTQQTFV